MDIEEELERQRQRASFNACIHIDSNGSVNQDSARSDSEISPDTTAKISPFQKHLCKPIRLKSREEKPTLSPTHVNLNRNEYI